MRLLEKLEILAYPLPFNRLKNYDVHYRLMSRRFWLFAFSAALAALSSEAANVRGIYPPGLQTAGPYSPGVVAGDYLYVSGQGARTADGTLASDPVSQLRECLNKIRTIAEAAGFKEAGMVYSQVYVRDAAAFASIDRAWSDYFANHGPARSIIGVANLPADNPVEVNAVLIRNAAAKTVLFVKGSTGSVPDIVVTPDRAFVSDCRGASAGDVRAEVKESLDRMGVVLKAAGLDYRHMVFVNPFLTDAVGYEAMNGVYATYFEFGNTPARATINVASLPGRSRVEFTGVAVRDLSQRRAVRPKNMPPSPTASPCVFAGDTFYCSAKSGFIPGPQSGVYAESVEGQLRQTMRNLLDGLEEAGLGFENVVATNVYLDDMGDFPKMNPVYKLFFTETLPARTTVQQRAAVERKAGGRGEWPTFEQISLIAVRGPAKFELQENSQRFWDLIDPRAKLDTVANRFGFTEGPVWDERGFLYISDEVTNKIFKLFPDGRHEDVVSLGDPDGSTYDRAHRLIDCASVLRAIIAVEPSGKYTMLADRYQGRKFNSPNDVVLGPGGALYFTDPTLDLPKGEKQELGFQGVFRLDADGKVRLLVKDLAQPNGLAFSPDGTKLYVDDSERKDIHVYDVAPDGVSVSNGRLFGTMEASTGVPDGMRVDIAGNLYVTGPGGVWVWDSGGTHLGTIQLPESAANLTWGDADYQTLYITASTSVFKLRTKVSGYVPYKGAAVSAPAPAKKAATKKRSRRSR
jgi:gluconolactonase